MSRRLILSPSSARPPPSASNPRRPPSPIADENIDDAAQMLLALHRYLPTVQVTQSQPSTLTDALAADDDHGYVRPPADDDHYDVRPPNVSQIHPPPYWTTTYRASLNERVQKYRDSKKQTQQGIDEMKAKNRVYSERNYRKKQVKRLSEEKARMLTALDPVQHQEVEIKALTHRDGLASAKKRGAAFTEDEERDIHVKVLKYEIKLMKQFDEVDKMLPQKEKRGKSVKERVQKFRENKKKTKQGIEELKAKDRVYSSRSYRKNQAKRLSDEKSRKITAFDPAQNPDVDDKALAYRDSLLQKKRDTNEVDCDR